MMFLSWILGWLPKDVVLSWVSPLIKEEEEEQEEEEEEEEEEKKKKHSRNPAQLITQHLSGQTIITPKSDQMR